MTPSSSLWSRPASERGRRCARLFLAAALLLPVAALVPDEASGVSDRPTRPARPYDFDGDGFADLAVGVPGEGVGRVPGAGAVTTLHGSAGGLGRPGITWTLDSPGVRGAPVAGAGFGEQLTSADFDRDGYADLAVAAPRAPHAQRAVTVLFGSRRGLTASGDQRLVAPADVHGSWGLRLGSGDVDGDGYGDLVVAAPRLPEEAPVEGVVEVLRGSAHGLSVDRAVRLDGNGAEAFGAAIAVGDLTGDGRDDLAVSGGENAQTPGNAPVHVWPGARRGLDLGAHQVLTPADLGVHGFDFRDLGDQLGIGDTDGDGYGELLIGDRNAEAPREEGCTNRASCLGIVVVLRGTANGPTATGRRVLWAELPGSPRRPVRAAFANPFVLGDLNGDGRDELVAGAGFGNFVTVFPGSATGLTSRGSRIWSQDTPGVPGTTEELDAFGSSLQVLDVGRGRTADLIVGAPNESLHKTYFAGAVWTLYGTRTGLTAAGSQSFNQDTPGVQGKAERSDAFGTLGS